MREGIHNAAFQIAARGTFAINPVRPEPIAAGIPRESRRFALQPRCHWSNGGVEFHGLMQPLYSIADVNTRLARLFRDINPETRREIISDPSPREGRRGTKPRNTLALTQTCLISD